MILQAKGGCYLTEAADVKIEQRHFAQTVYLGAADEALAWREVTEAEKEKMLQQGTVFDTSQLSGEYLDKVDALMLAIPAQINDAAPLPEAEALEHIGWYPEWGDENAPMGKEVEPGFRFTYGGTLYEAVKAHALQADWLPGEGTESLYKEVAIGHAGRPHTLRRQHGAGGGQILCAGRHHLPLHPLHRAARIPCAQRAGGPICGEGGNSDRSRNRRKLIYKTRLKTKC